MRAEHELHALRPAEPASPRAPVRIVCLGGGTGLPRVLRGLKRYVPASPSWPGLRLTAVVAMADDGGSSGRLRRELGLLPPGDLRNCLVALADGRRRTLRRLFQHRFEGGGALQGHAVGNLVLSALAQRGGDFLEATRLAGELLGVRGRVMPSTLRPVVLRAELCDGQRIRGERALSRARCPVLRAALDPERPPPAPGVLSALASADLVVLGPGSLYSSVLATLLVDGVADAVARSPALKVWVQNLSPQRGETAGLSALDHLAVLRAHAGPVVDAVLAHDGPTPIEVDARAIARAGAFVVRGDVAASDHRHHPERLGAWLLRLALWTLAARGRPEEEA